MKYRWNWLRGYSLYAKSVRKKAFLCNWFANRNSKNDIINKKYEWNWHLNVKIFQKKTIWSVNQKLPRQQQQSTKLETTGNSGQRNSFVRMDPNCLLVLSVLSVIQGCRFVFLKSFIRKIRLFLPLSNVENLAFILSTY